MIHLISLWTVIDPAQKKTVQSRVRGVGPEGRTESMVGRIYERGRFQAGSERVGELRLRRRRLEK